MSFFLMKNSLLCSVSETWAPPGLWWLQPECGVSLSSSNTLWFAPVSPARINAFPAQPPAGLYWPSLSALQQLELCVWSSLPYKRKEDIDRQRHEPHSITVSHLEHYSYLNSVSFQSQCLNFQRKLALLNAFELTFPLSSRSPPSAPWVCVVRCFCHLPVFCSPPGRPAFLLTPCLVSAWSRSSSFQLVLEVAGHHCAVDDSMHPYFMHNKYGCTILGKKCLDI